MPESRPVENGKETARFQLRLRRECSNLLLQSSGGRGCRKKNRCRRIKRWDATVIWDDATDPKRNRQKVQEQGNSEDEVESVVLDDDAVVVPNQSFPEHCLAFGFTHIDRFIAVAFEIVDEDVPIVRPITAFEPSED
jgi:hypothetical protein